MGKTKIEWATTVWNPVAGCTKISPGCEHCYAERMAKRLAGRYGYPKENPFQVTFHRERLNEPAKWKKPQRVFVCSMGDLFHEDVHFQDISIIWWTMLWFSQHTYMILTKRPERIIKFFEYLESDIGGWKWITEGGTNKRYYKQWKWPLPNVWIGVTAENQEMADKRIPVLLQIPAAVRFVSVEPMLGPINLIKDDDLYWEPTKQQWVPRIGLDWVICGGETGPGARPMCPDWVRDLRDQCISAEVPFFFKSWGDWAPWYGDEDDGCPGDPECEEINCSGCRKARFWRFTGGGPAGYEPRDVLYSVRVGKKAAGRILDGQEWNQLPNKL
ncbi:phage Gp37/Gp68 family protein [Biomaibacter acetigenes]|uniref:Phage Gp37/Gp68 family protein n=1 Tax=Biomaibacter acetigenes TaxID=2316383 RepID=A0A3G2R699_9FIRM|nr:phage Gp37/Gp68 family protein [Biomaibacter acetigenes]AYO30628.1 phage Gp37/Gp68 family protein [Biomaibacter acetigenes]